MNLLEKINQTTKFLMQKGFTADVAVILGTGLGQKFLSSIEIIQEIDYADIPNFPIATVEFHKGKLILGKTEKVKILIFQGRFHYYEGFSMQEISYPVRVAKALKTNYILISNASGSLNTDWKKGEIMLINDHINLLPGNPLIGQNFEELGPRFPDMIEPYNNTLNQIIRDFASINNINIREGVYVSAPGPMLETKAEYRYMRNIGADAVGMSTVPEVITAVHAGLPVCAISVLTDDCDPDNLQPVDIAEIIDLAGKAEPLLSKLFLGLIEKTSGQMPEKLN